MNNCGFWQAINSLVDTSKIVIDRKKLTAHPKYPDMIYPLDYGYLSGTTSMDGGGIDCFVGSLEEKRTTAVICIVDIVKKDSEIKILISCTKEEQDIALEFCNKTDGMKGILIKDI